ncbi:MAG: glycosyltransferase [Bacteroidales bacterium]|jgi:glycosyltransferase involved in cell wall biosynthesis
MSIVIFGDNFSFPEGNAATNRVYTYAKGFIENNVNAYVICFGNDYLANGYGVVEKIQFFHPLNQKKRNNSFILRNWFKLTKCFNTIKIIRKINKEDRIEAIIAYTKFSSTHLFSWFLVKIIRTKLIIENSEHPLRYYQNGFINRIIGNLKLGIELGTFDGILLITQNLIDFYKSKLHNDNKLLLVPSTVDPTRFAIEKTKNNTFEYIGYFGSIDLERDNIDLLITAYSLIHERLDNVHLVLGGMVEKKEEKIIFDLIKSLKIESKVHIIEYLSREEIIQYVVNAKVLVLVRHNDPFTEASFPCKFTEYLSTGNPVISVMVSEIPKFIKDGENGFLITPGDAYELSEKLGFVLNNYQFATEIAKKGKELTDSIFNYNYQAKKIIDFIHSI